MLALAGSAFAAPPTLDHLFPGGVARGASAEVTASGKFDRWPVRGWSSSPGIAIEAGGEKGKLTIRAAPDAPPGLHWVRLFDEEGATAPRPFLVGLVPEVVEVEPNDAPGAAQRVGATPATINGRLEKNGDVDTYSVRLKKGQTLVAAMEANRRLGSPMDGVLQVASPEGFVLAQVDDEAGRDPIVVFEAPADGDFLVRAFAFPFVQESSIRFAGGAAFIYRLTLTAGPFVDHPFPLALARGESGEVDLAGWNIPEAGRRLTIEAAGDLDDEGVIRVALPTAANEAEIRVFDGPSIVEPGAGAPPAPRPIRVPVAISGRIDPPGDVDAFSFAAAKGDRIDFRVESRSLGLPLDALLRVEDAGGAVLAEVDDVKGAVDPETRFVAPADGPYRVTVRDLNRRGGLRHAYLLTATAPSPDFALSLKADQFPLAPGKPTEIVVAVDRREGYAEAIKIGLASHFDGVIAPAATSFPAGPTAKAVTLKLSPCDCARTGPIRVVGVAGDGRTRAARAPVPGSSRTIGSAWLSTPKAAPAGK